MSKRVMAEVRNNPGAVLAIALECGGELVTESAERSRRRSRHADDAYRGAETAAAPSQLRLAISTKQGTALSLALDDSAAAQALKQALADPSIPKAIYDSKAATHVLADRGIALAGVQHDPLLYAYLLDPTYTKYSLADVALRSFNLKMGDNLGEAADLTLRLAGKAARRSRRRRTDERLRRDRSPHVARAGAHGGTPASRSTPRCSPKCRSAWSATPARRRARIWEKCGTEFNINSPKQLGDVLFNKLNLPKPMKYGKGKTISTAVDVLEGLAAEHEVPRMVLDYRQLTKLKSTYVDALPALLNPATRRLHTTFNMAGSATGRLSSINPNLQNIPIRTELGREIRAAFVAEPGNLLLAADYSQIELRLLAHFSEDPLLVEAYRTRPGHSHPHRLAGLRRPGRRSQRRASPPRQSRQLRHRLWALGLRAVAANRHRPERGQALHRRLLRKVRRRAHVHRPHPRAGARRTESRDALRAHPPAARHAQQELEPARLRRAHRRQHTAAGHRRRPHQAGHDPHRRRTAPAQPAIAHAAASARRAGLRSPRIRTRRR